MQEELDKIISFDEFKKIDLRVGKVLEAEKVQGSEKLLKLEINLGGEKRQILAGLAPFLTPEELVGKNLVIVVSISH